MENLMFSYVGKNALEQYFDNAAEQEILAGVKVFLSTVRYCVYDDAVGVRAGFGKNSIVVKRKFRSGIAVYMWGNKLEDENLKCKVRAMMYRYRDELERRRKNQESARIAEAKNNWDNFFAQDPRQIECLGNAMKKVWMI